MPAEKNVEEIALVLEIRLVDIRAHEVERVTRNETRDDDWEKRRTRKQ